MQVIVEKKCDKFLSKQVIGDKKGITKVNDFLKILEKTPEPTKLPNAKKMQGYSKNIWRWRVGQYRIVGEVKENELLIYIIEISTRENAY